MDIRLASRCLLFNKSHYNHNVQDYVQAWYLYIAWHLSNVQHTKNKVTLFQAMRTESRC